MSSRHFKGIWIPSEIWLDPKLSIQGKIMLAEIDSLSGKAGCYATNRYFANFFKLSRGRISQILTELKKLGYINIHFDEKDGISVRFLTLKEPIRRPKNPEKLRYRFSGGELPGDPIDYAAYKKRMEIE